MRHVSPTEQEPVALPPLGLVRFLALRDATIAVMQPVSHAEPTTFYVVIPEHQPATSSTDSVRAQPRARPMGTVVEL